MGLTGLPLGVSLILPGDVLPALASRRPRLLRSVAGLAVMAYGLIRLASAARGRAASLTRVSWLGGNWFVLGYNFPWHQYNYDFGNDQYANVHYYSATINSQFADLRAHGTHATRWYVFNNAAAYPLFDAQGRVSGLPASFFQNFDDALAIAAANNV